MTAAASEGQGDRDMPAAPAEPAVIVARDYGTPPIAEMLQHVAAQHGKSYRAQIRELLRYCLGNNRLTAEEYFALRLYDDAAVPPAEKANFVGIAKSRAIWEAVYEDSTWLGVIVDKIAAGALFAGAGYPVPQIAAVFEPHLRLPGMRMLHDAAAIESFLREAGDRQLFGKPVGANQSLGSIAISGVDAAAGTLRAGNGAVLDIKDFAQLVATEFHGGYVFQERLRPHPAVVAVCGDRIATVRLLTICQEGEPEIVAAAWKIPVGDNMADNFWRPGNLVAPVDEASGTVGTAVRGTGIRRKEMAAHPDSGAAIAGLVLPHWRETRDLVLSASRFLKDILLIGWDIALTPDGPVIVEANETPDLMLVQHATGRGILTERFRAYLDWVAAARRTRRAELRRKVRQTQRREAIRLIEGAKRL